MKLINFFDSLYGSTFVFIFLASLVLFNIWLSQAQASPLLDQVRQDPVHEVSHSGVDPRVAGLRAPVAEADQWDESIDISDQWDESIKSIDQWNESIDNIDQWDESIDISDQ